MLSAGWAVLIKTKYIYIYIYISGTLRQRGINHLLSCAIATTNLIRGETRFIFRNRLYSTNWWMSCINDQFLSQLYTFSSLWQHFLGILWSLFPFAGNLPSILRPNSCIVVWQQLICQLVLLPSFSMLPLTFWIAGLSKTGGFLMLHSPHLIHSKERLYWPRRP